MPHPFDSTSPSPDLQHTARFAYSGESRFGPPYFSLQLTTTSSRNASSVMYISGRHHQRYWLYRNG
jgi:hypothetical protein